MWTKVDTVRITKKLQQSFCIWWQNIHYHIANMWNRITAKIFDMFRIITLKQQKFSLSDPVLIRQFSKKLQSDPVLIRPKLASVLIQYWSVLISGDVLFISLKVWIPSVRENCIEPREYRKIHFHQYHLEIVYFFLHKTINPFQVFFYGHNLFHLDNPVLDPVEEETVSNPNPKHFQYTAGLNSKIRILYTTGVPFIAKRCTVQIEISNILQKSHLCRLHLR